MERIGRCGEDTGVEGKEGGYQSGDSYDSEDFERTKEDDDFIDADDEDPDALKELYAEHKDASPQTQSLSHVAQVHVSCGHGHSKCRHGAQQRQGIERLSPRP